MRPSLVFTCALLWAGAFGSAVVVGAETTEAPSEPRVGVLIDNYPFSFRTADGRVDGFVYQLTREIEQVMGLKFVRVEGTTREINTAFREGRLDLVQSYAEFPERSREAMFSVPYVTMAGAIFVRGDERNIRSLSDLRGRRVAVHRGSLGEAVLRRAGLEDSIVVAESVEDALQQVSQGKADATLVGRLSGLSLGYHLGLTNLRALAGDISGYQVRYCLAVQRGNPELLAHLNEGLAILVRTGRFDRIYGQWFRQVEPVGYTTLQIVLAISVGLALALLVSLWSVVHLRRMQSRMLQQKEALRVSEEWHRAVFEGARDGLLVLERDASHGLVVRQLNASAIRLLRLPAAPHSGVPLVLLLGADRALASRLNEAATAGGIADFEYTRANDAGFWRVTAGPLDAGMLLSLGDITEAVRGRQQLREQEQKLMQSQKLEAIGTLAGGIAHDFNNMLTAIIGNTELSLMTLPPDRPEVESLQSVLHAAGRARQLVRQILTFSRRQETTRQPLDAAPIIRETLDFLRTAARGTLTIESRGAEATPPIMADPGQLHQVLMNIGTNAVQAMRGTPGRLTFEQHPVVVSAADASAYAPLQAGRYVRISIQDTGPGIPANVLPRIFEPFFTTKPPGEGTGLGLSVVHGIMQQHGGAVMVHSQPGRGTRFDLYFPEAEGPAGRSSSAPPFATAGNGEMILVVDDDPDNVRTVRQIVLQLGYRAATFERAADALTAFRARPEEFAVVLTDLAMPVMNGLQFATQVRAVRSTTPLIIASGFFTEAEEREAAKLHLTRMIHKPLTVAILSEAVATALKSTRS